MTHLLKFYELPAEEQAAITKAIVTECRGVEEYSKSIRLWGRITERLINPTGYYRLAPKKLDIPWEAIDNKFNYAVLENDGTVWIGGDAFTIDNYERRGNYWESQRGCLKLRNFHFDTTEIDYKTSQTKRP